MGSLLSKIGLGSAAPIAPPPKVEAPAALRFFTLREELQSKFPGSEVTVFSHDSAYALSAHCEIKGKRADGTAISLKAEVRYVHDKPGADPLLQLLKEVDSWPATMPVTP